MKQAVEAVFMDRDGTIGGTGRFIHPNNFKLYPNAQQAINMLKENHIQVFAFTNQHRISRGEATIEEFKAQFQSYGFTDSYICPHGPHDHCDCRKPKAGMLLQAAEEYGLNLSRCVVIGDVGDTDMLAAHQVGAQKVLVRTGWGEESLGEYRARWQETEADYIANNVLEAVEWILNRNTVRCDND